jgi:hypothetical protein
MDPIPNLPTPNLPLHESRIPNPTPSRCHRDLPMMGQAANEQATRIQQIIADVDTQAPMRLAPTPGLSARSTPACCICDRRPAAKALAGALLEP